MTIKSALEHLSQYSSGDLILVFQIWSFSNKTWGNQYLSISKHYYNIIYHFFMNIVHTLYNIYGQPSVIWIVKILDQTFENSQNFRYKIYIMNYEYQSPQTFVSPNRPRQQNCFELTPFHNFNQISCDVLRMTSFCVECRNHVHAEFKNSEWYCFNLWRVVQYQILWS